MLAGIGVIIILKQIPHALGQDSDFEGDFSFLQFGGNNTLSELANAVVSASLGAVIIFAVGLALMFLWDRAAGKARLFQLVPGQLAVVVAGIGLNQLFSVIAPGLEAQPAHLVNLPVPASMADFLRQFTSPDFSAISNQTVWTTALTIALAGSTETLLSLEAADRLDPYKRMSSPSRELRAQGIANVVSGLIGGYP
jgi:MFS superfamily sulfate permease-like transporter